MCSKCLCPVSYANAYFELIIFDAIHLIYQEKIYMDNLDVSVAVLRKLTEDWRQLSAKQSSLEGLGDALKSFRQKVVVPLLSSNMF